MLPPGEVIASEFVQVLGKVMSLSLPLSLSPPLSLPLALSPSCSLSLLLSLPLALSPLFSLSLISLILTPRPSP